MSTKIKDLHLIAFYVQKPRAGVNTAIADGPRSSVISNLRKIKTLLDQLNTGKITELSTLC